MGNFTDESGSDLWELVVFDEIGNVWWVGENSEDRRICWLTVYDKEKPDLVDGSGRVN